MHEESEVELSSGKDGASDWGKALGPQEMTSTKM